VAGFPEGHPATPNRLLEMDHFKAKVDAGADYIVTQLFFDNRDFLDFRERCALVGINIPIIAGIMPITSISGFKRIAELAGGARFPPGFCALYSVAKTILRWSGVSACISR
jgi:5,10-methylenetetrahydrofolate reductase